MSEYDGNREPEAESNPRQEQPAGSNVLIAHITRNKVDFALWATRLATIFFTVNYLVPIFGHGQTFYWKALQANAATSALRLHQRLPRVQLSREFLGQLFIEDSAHYLMYSLVFLYCSPVTWVLLPIFLFAVLHISSNTLELINLLGPNSMKLLRIGIGIVEVQSANLLKTIAYAEIFLFPLLIITLFSGRVTLMTIFVYYRFLTLRFSSRRNPYTRNAFGELRVAVEGFAQRPNVPEGIRNFITKAVSFISRLAPATVQQSAQ